MNRGMNPRQSIRQEIVSEVQTMECLVILRGIFAVTLSGHCDMALDCNARRYRILREAKGV